MTGTPDSATGDAATRSSTPESRQRPLGSGFDATTTAADVVAGLDLSGRLAIVTGGYSGLGLEITRALAAAGADVIVPARRPEVATGNLADVDRVEVATLDLGDLDSVAAFAGQVVDAGRRVDMLIGNAGVMACPLERIGPGWERQFATNHLGHFALLNRLAPALADGARVVSVSSRGHHFSPVRLDDVHFEHGEYDKWQAYGRSKTANVLFAVHLDALARSHDDRGIRAFALHPGGILTPLQRHLPREEMVELGWILPDGSPGPAASSFKTPAQGAATATWAATSPQLDGHGGVYLEDCEVATLVDETEEADGRGGRTGGVMAWAIDPDQAARLWTLSAELTGVDAFART